MGSMTPGNGPSPNKCSTSRLPSVPFAPDRVRKVAIGDDNEAGSRWFLMFSTCQSGNTTRVVTRSALYGRLDEVEPQARLMAPMPAEVLHCAKLTYVHVGSGAQYRRPGDPGPGLWWVALRCQRARKGQNSNITAARCVLGCYSP
jgi:hypothetical protein